MSKEEDKKKEEEEEEEIPDLLDDPDVEQIDLKWKNVAERLMERMQQQSDDQHGVSVKKFREQQSLLLNFGMFAHGIQERYAKAQKEKEVILENKEHLVHRVANLEIELDCCKSQLSKLKEENEKLQKENEMLKENQKYLEAREETCDAHTEEFESALVSISKLTIERNELQDQLKASELKCACLESSKQAKFNEMYDKLNAENSGLRERLLEEGKRVEAMGLRFDIHKAGWESEKKALEAKVSLCLEYLTEYPKLEAKLCAAIEKLNKELETEKNCNKDLKKRIADTAAATLIIKEADDIETEDKKKEEEDKDFGKRTPGCTDPSCKNGVHYTEYPPGSQYTRSITRCPMMVREIEPIPQFPCCWDYTGDREDLADGFKTIKTGTTVEITQRTIASESSSNPEYDTKGILNEAFLGVPVLREYKGPAIGTVESVHVVSDNNRIIDVTALMKKMEEDIKKEDETLQQEFLQHFREVGFPGPKKTITKRPSPPRKSAPFCVHCLSNKEVEDLRTRCSQLDATLMLRTRQFCEEKTELLQELEFHKNEHLKLELQLQRQEELKQQEKKRSYLVLTLKDVQGK